MSGPSASRRRRGGRPRAGPDHGSITGHDREPPAQPDIELWGDGRPDDLKAATWPLRFEWQQHDAIALSRLTPEQLEAQRQARNVVLDFVLDHLAVIDDVDEIPPEWQSVVAMVDLLTDLLGDAVPDALQVLEEALDEPE